MRLGTLVLALGAVALLSGPALAQRQPGGRGQGGGLTQLVQNKSVQDELKIDKDQAAKVKEALDKVREDLKDEYTKVGRRSTASDDEKAAARKKIEEAGTKAITGTLKDDQVKRLRQIERQQQGVALLQGEEVQKTLKLKDEQKEKIKTIAADLEKDVRELSGGGGGRNPETRTKIQGLRKEAMTNALKVLTDDQKKAVKDLTGEPFEVKVERQGAKPAKPRTDF